MDDCPAIEKTSGEQPVEPLFKAVARMVAWPILSSIAFTDVWQIATVGVAAD
jgi:hypothetical protein